MLLRWWRRNKNKHHLHDLQTQAWSAYVVLQVMVVTMCMMVRMVGTRMVMMMVRMDHQVMKVTMVVQGREQGHCEEVCGRFSEPQEHLL